MYYNIIISFLIRSSEEMYTHLENTLASAECNSNVGQGTFICTYTVYMYVNKKSPYSTVITQ